MMGGGVVVVLSPRSNEAKLRTLVGICSADHAKRFNTRQNEGGEEWYHVAHPQTTEMTSSPLQLRPNRRITFNGLYVVGRHRRPRIFM